MKVLKKLIVTSVMVLTLATTSVTAFAASQYSTPAEVVAGITGRNVQSIIDERLETGKTYGVIASEAGVFDAFQVEMLEMKKDSLNASVAAGRRTQEQADAILRKITNRHTTCDGSGIGNGAGCEPGSGFGRGEGQGTGMRRGNGQTGRGAGQGAGMGQGCGQSGRGHGLGLRDGSCITN